MKRTDITELFPDAPKEAIDKLMGIYGADVNAAKSEVEDLRRQLSEQKNSPELQKAQEQMTKLQTELDSMKNAEALRLMREKVSGEKKVPIHLLTGETEEACAKQADDILAFSQGTGYPVIRDGGEIHNRPKIQTRDMFATWAEENL